jgi:hypothetical protein
MAYIVNATVTEVEASSVTLTKPTGVTNGDVLIAVMGSAEPIITVILLFMHQLDL